MKRNKKKKNMIDMTGRLHVQIVAANKDEIDLNNKYFDELNRTIELKIKACDESVNLRVMELLAKAIDQNIEPVHSIDYYESMLKTRNIEHLQEQLQLYQTYLSQMNNESYETKKQETD